MFSRQFYEGEDILIVSVCLLINSERKILLGCTVFPTRVNPYLTLLRSKRPKLYGVLAVLSAVGLKWKQK